MTPEQFIALKASEAVRALYNADAPESIMQVGVTRKDFEGDYTLVVFPLLKITHAAPAATATAIGEWMVANCPEIAAFNAVQGFLNLSLSNLYWKETLEAVIADPNFGQLPANGRRVMVEFSSPNTNKPLHLGHVRNNLLGSSVSDLLKAAGNEVIKTTLVNDRGVHICKSMYAWEQSFDGATPESTGKKGDHLVGDCYVEFNNIYSAEVKKLMAEGMDEETAKKEAPSIKAAHEMLVKWEQNDPAVRKLWEMMNEWVFAGFDETYKALGISFDKTYYEHETYILGKEIVERGLEMGVLVREADGSVWCDLTGDGLDRKLLIRSDGTSVYITQDLGTAERRFSEYSLDSHVYVVGDEQNYHFQVLKLILGKLGYKWADQIYHLSYGMVELPEGKMKSREGTVVDADDLIQKMYEEAKATSEESGKLEGISDEEKDKLFHMIGLGALKYFILKVDPRKKMLFNPKESIDFNGNTGPFIQYTHARICSILRKAAAAGCQSRSGDCATLGNIRGGTACGGVGAADVAERELATSGQIPADVELSGKEIRLVKLIGSYPQKVAEAAEAYSPAVIANYAYDLAKEFNQYYHETQILKEPDQDILKMRLALIATLASVLRKAMGILGIELPERM